MSYLVVCLLYGDDREFVMSAWNISEKIVVFLVK